MRYYESETHMPDKTEPLNLASCRNCDGCSNMPDTIEAKYENLVAWARLACELLDTYPDAINGPRLVVSMCPAGPFEKPPKPKRRKRQRDEEPSEDEYMRSAERMGLMD
jgi:hypothetical protein